MRVALSSRSSTARRSRSPVSIDEAVSITRRYCGTEAPGFVNGVLSAIARGIAAEEEATA